MRFHTFKKYILNKTDIRPRLQTVFFGYVSSLMLETRKHSLTFASELSGISKPRFSRFLRNNYKILSYTLENLSKKQARMYSGVIGRMKSLPWKVFIMIDDTHQKRSAVRSDNAQKFNSGHGYVIGHQWTNIILFFNNMIIPLPPIPFYTKKYCRKNGLKYETSHERLVRYLRLLNLNEYIGFHQDGDVAVLTDSGFDDKKIRNTISDRGWHFISALKSNRGMKSEAKYAKTPKSSEWDGIAMFFKKHRKLAWETIRISADDTKKKRKEFRIRHAGVYLKGVGKIRAVCSEFGKKRDGRRKYIACGDPDASPRQILIAYRLRWKIEIFHKHVKTHLGFGDVAAKHFTSVISHVYLVYCAYILLQGLPGTGEKDRTVPGKQRRVAEFFENKEKAFILNGLTRMGGTEKYKNELKEALAA